MRFEQTMTEGLSYSVICNLRLVCYAITLILIEQLTNLVIYNSKMTYGEILDESHNQSFNNLDTSKLRMACINILVDSELRVDELKGMQTQNGL